MRAGERLAGDAAPGTRERQKAGVGARAERFRIATTLLTGVLELSWTTDSTSRSASS